MSRKLCYRIVFLLFLSYTSSLYAQNDAQLGHSSLWPSLNNPGALESYKAPLAGADIRIQWLGLEGQPFTQTLFAQMPIPNTSLLGGIVVANEIAGAHQVLHTDFQVAYPVKVKKQVIQVGGSIGFIQYSMFEARLRAADGVYTDNALMHNDPNLNNATVGNVVPNLNIGFRTQWKRVGLSAGIEHLYANQIKLKVNTGKALIQYTPLFTSVISYHWPELINNWQFKTIVLAKTNFTKAMIDWQNFATYSDKWRFGLFVRGFAPRNFDEVGALFGYNLNSQIQFNYSFEWPLNRLAQVSYGTQELSLVYKLQEPPPPSRGKIIFSPRFL